MRIRFGFVHFCTNQGCPAVQPIFTHTVSSISRLEINMVRGHTFRILIITDTILIFFTGTYNTVADPGFPVGGRGPRRGGVDSRSGYVSQILYVKTKESGPLGGSVPGIPP